MYPIPPNEHLLENKVCKHCQASFPITDKDMEFYEKISPVFDGKKYQIPSPTLCPDCRQQRRLSFWNERVLYKNICKQCSKDIISRISQTGGYQNYCNECWSSDYWNQHAFNIEYTFDKTFFSQIYFLIKNTPYQNLIGSLSNVKNNAVYTNHTADIANSYMVFNSGSIDNSFYSQIIRDSTFLFDCFFVYNSENCYQCIDCKNIYKVYFSHNCHECSNSYMLEDCYGCEYCIGCIGLRNKKYHILNKMVSEKEYKRFLDSGAYMSSEFQKSFRELQLDTPRRGLFILNSEDIIGDYIINSHACYHCYDIADSQNIKYSTSINNSEDIYDISAYGTHSYLLYEGVSVGRYSNNILFSSIIGRGENLYYCIDVKKSENCFGCVNMEGKQYCILNRQYTKEEYEELVPHIIERMMADGEWGEFFPASLSPFGYNETVAQEYYPMTRDSVIPAYAGSQKTDTIDSGINPEGQKQQNKETFLHGDIFNWSDYEAPFPKVEKIIPASRLPDTIDSIPDDILNWAIECEVSGKPFRIIKQELDFYRKHHLPIPRRHPDQRHLDRMKMRNPRKLFERLCDCTNCEENWRKKGIDFVEGENAGYKNPPVLSDIPLGKGGLRKRMITTYAPERPEIVYCDECYEREVVG